MSSDPLWCLVTLFSSGNAYAAVHCSEAAVATLDKVAPFGLLTIVFCWTSSRNALMYVCAICNVSYLDNFRSFPSSGMCWRKRSNASFRPFMRLRSRALAAIRRFTLTSGCRNRSRDRRCEDRADFARDESESASNSEPKSSPSEISDFMDWNWRK